MDEYSYSIPSPPRIKWDSPKAPIWINFYQLIKDKYKTSIFLKIIYVKHNLQTNLAVALFSFVNTLNHKSNLLARPRSRRHFDFKFNVALWLTNIFWNAIWRKASTLFNSVQTPKRKSKLLGLVEREADHILPLNLILSFGWNCWCEGWQASDFEQCHSSTRVTIKSCHPRYRQSATQRL